MPSRQKYSYFIVTHEVSFCTINFLICLDLLVCLHISTTFFNNARITRSSHQALCSINLASLIIAHGLPNVRRRMTSGGLRLMAYLSTFRTAAQRRQWPTMLPSCGSGCDTIRTDGAIMAKRMCVVGVPKSTAIQRSDIYSVTQVSCTRILTVAKGSHLRGSITAPFQSCRAQMTVKCVRYLAAEENCSRHR